MIINGEQAVKLPEKGSHILKYENFHKQQPAPFVIYADFEALTEKVHGCQPDNNSSFTDLYQKHTDCGFGYKVVVTTINTPNQFKFTKVKRPFISF